MRSSIDARGWSLSPPTRWLICWCTHDLAADGPKSCFTPPTSSVRMNFGRWSSWEFVSLPSPSSPSSYSSTLSYSFPGYAHRLLARHLLLPSRPIRQLLSCIHGPPDIRQHAAPCIAVRRQSISLLIGVKRLLVRLPPTSRWLKYINDDNLTTWACDTGGAFRNNWRVMRHACFELNSSFLGDAIYACSCTGSNLAKCHARPARFHALLLLFCHSQSLLHILSTAGNNPIWINNVRRLCWRYLKAIWIKQGWEKSLTGDILQL